MSLPSTQSARRRRRRSPLLLGAATLIGYATIWACSSGGDGSTTPTPPPPTPTIAISAGGGLSGQQGTTQSTTISLTRGGNYTGAVSLAASGVPAGVTVTLTPESLTGSTATSTLSAVISGSAAPTTGSITVTATGSGVSSATTAVPITITAAPTPDFTLSPATANVTVVQGAASANTSFTLARVNNYTGSVTLAASGLPTGVVATFTQPGTGTTGGVVFSALGTAGTGTYPITITATGPNATAKTAAITLVVQATPTVVLGVTPQALSAAQGGSAQTSVSITRTNVTGDVTLTAENVPTGVTATFSASPTAAATSTLSLAVGASVPAGVYNITVRGTAAGATAGTATVTLTVSAAQSYSLSASAVSVQAGATGTSTVTVTRSGGFAGAVTLALSNLPAGVTATISPNPATGASSTITFTAASGAAAGSFTATVTGTATGLANVTTTVGVTVTPGGGGGGSGNSSWTFCDSEDFPLWFAVQQGSGAWTPVTPTGTTTRVYTFNMNGNGGVAYAQPISGGGVSVVVQYLSQDEIVFGGTNICDSDPAKKTLTGTVAGLSAGQSATVSVGGGSGSTSANGPVTVSGVPFGTTDLFAVRTAFNLSTFSLVPDRAVLRRNVNFASVISPNIDFAGGDSFALTSAAYTFVNAGSDPIQVSTGFLTQNGTAGTFVSALNTTTSPVTVYGVPSNLTQSGDLHQVLAVSISGSGTSTSSRGVTQYNRDIAARTVTFGPVLSSPTISSLGSTPYVRYSATGPWQTDYASSVGVGYTRAVTGSNAWTISMSRTYSGAGASTYSLVMPDFSGVAGFNTAWGIGSGTANVSITAAGVSTGFITSTGQWTEGGFFRFGARTTTVSP